VSLGRTLLLLIAVLAMSCKEFMELALTYDMGLTVIVVSYDMGLTVVVVSCDMGLTVVVVSLTRFLVLPPLSLITVGVAV